MTELTLFYTTLTATDTALLTAEQEKELSKMILAGKEASRRLETGCPSFTEDERSELDRIVYYGQLAYERLVTANLRLACKLANTTSRKNRGRIDETQDYEQVAYIALCECAQTFDWHYGNRFSTYAYPRMKQALIRENACIAYSVRLPEALLYKIPGMNALLETQPIDKTARDLAMSVEQACKLKAVTDSGASLDQPLNSVDLDCELGELIADQMALTGQDIEEHLQFEDLLEWFWSDLENLQDWERELICKRFGLCGEEPHKLCELTGVTAKTVGGVQKQIMAILHRLKDDYERYEKLPMAA